MSFEIKHTVAPADAIEQMNQIMDKVLQDLPVDNHDLIMTHVPTLDEIADEFRDEICTCNHKSSPEDHTFDFGCERRGCPCFFWLPED
ncbi:MAG TPA: hypothetical protein VIY48_01740 [Candidatus Paceibacterota bacterium]